MSEERRLLQELETIKTSDPPLTADEMQRLTRAVLRRTGQAGAQKQGQTRRLHKTRRLPVWGRALAGGAACVALLAGLNAADPALAEELPVLGNVFAAINSQEKAPLKSEQLADYAQPAQIEAGAQPDTAAAPDTAVAPDAAAPEVQAKAVDGLHPETCTLTLSQLYCDELYLRVGLVLTAQDDTLAAFDTVTIDPPLLWEEIPEQELNTLYGGVTLNGQAVSGDILPCFRKQDDHTFFCEMQYNLQGYTGVTQDMQASLTFSNLVGVTGKTGEKTPLPGVYALEFVVSADETLTRMGTFADAEQNGLTLTSVTVTPGETRVAYTAQEPLPGGAAPALQVYAVQGQTLTPLQAAGGRVQEDGAQGGTLYTDDFDAVPEGVRELKVQAVDKNGKDLAVLAEWTVTLP